MTIHYKPAEKNMEINVQHDPAFEEAYDINKHYYNSFSRSPLPIESCPQNHETIHISTPYMNNRHIDFN